MTRYTYDSDEGKAIIQQIDKLCEAAKARREACKDDFLRNIKPSGFDWMTDDEREQYQALQLQIRQTSPEEARARVNAKREARRQAQENNKMQTFEGHYYTVTDETITPTGKVEIYTAESRDEAVMMTLYTHRLHNGNAWGTEHGVIHCPSCGQIAIVSKPEQQEEQFPQVWTPDGMQYTFGAGSDPIQPNLL